MQAQRADNEDGGQYLTGNETMLSSMYGQGNLFTYYMRNKARHRESFPCPKKSKLNRGVELCALTRSVTTTWLIAPAATKYNGSNHDSETGHKIVTSGAPLANTSATTLAKILMVGNADTSTVKGLVAEMKPTDRPTKTGLNLPWLGRFCLPLSLQSKRTNR